MTNSPPTISDVAFEEASPYFVDQKVHIIATATDPDGDQILYRFFIKRAANLWEALTGWEKKNWLSYTIDKLDYPGIDIKCQVRDGLHKLENSFDAEVRGEHCHIQGLAHVCYSFAFQPAGQRDNNIVHGHSQQDDEHSIPLLAEGPGTGDVWVDKTGWQTSNSWKWRTLYCDVGTNQIKVQVVEDPVLWDDADTAGREIVLEYTIA